jgi:MoxR-like ATPase
MKIDVNTGLLGYGEFDRVATLAVASGEHLLLVGPPGVAKTLAVTRFCAYLEGGLFSVQLSKFSDETALFGMPNMKTLREKGEIVYPKRGLATCYYFHADEIFDASDVLLRTLLSSLEERKILRGETIEDIPLNTCFATANYVRRNEVVDAIIDRFVLSMVAPTPTEAHRKHLYDHEQEFEAKPSVKESEKVTMESILQVRKDAHKVSLDSELVEALLDWTKEQNFSPRRERKLGKLLRTNAALNGRDEIREEDIEMARFVLPLQPDAAKSGKSNPKDAIKSLKDKLKVLLNEKQQLVDIEQALDIKGDDLATTKNIVEAVKKLKNLSPVNAKVGDKQKQAIAKLVDKHAKLISKLGVTL